MTYELKFTSAYKRAYKRLKKRGADLSLLDEVIALLQNGEKLDPKFRDHELQGQFKGFRECHVKPDWLLIYLIDRGVLTLTLVDTGTHSEILGL